MEWDIANRASGEFGYEDRVKASVRLCASRSSEGCASARTFLEPSTSGTHRKFGSLVLMMVAIVLGAPSRSLAWDGGDGDIAPTTAAAVAVVGVIGPAGPIEPWIHHKMGPAVRARLEAGFSIAVERVREIEPCADLFTRLGADPIDMLKTGLYLAPHSYLHEIVLCGRDPIADSRGADNLGYTVVGGSPTWICRHFARVSDETAAITVIHEALHHAGLTEWPLDRMAMSSIEITEMVEDVCGFQ